jgi:diaminopimelate epimerase
MKFSKMHGCGNDYVYVNGFNESVKDPSSLSVKISDRHFGIGSDGLILILPSDIADFRMRMFNSDGSEAEMCGNAIRCVGKFVYDNGLTDKLQVSIETLAGIKFLEMIAEDNKIKQVKVDMGEPILKPSRIPVNAEGTDFISRVVKVNNAEYKLTCVSMGNPHAIAYVDNVTEFPLEIVGPKVETHDLFPRKINSEFVEVIDRSTLKMRVWERGAGETMACGTGACAVLVASVLNNLCERKAVVKLLGGDLLIEWNKDNNHVYMTGPAVKVFDGEIRI